MKINHLSKAPSPLDVTLPVRMDLGFDPQLATKVGEELSLLYTAAQGFPHLVIDKFLPAHLINSLYKNFPDQNFQSEKIFENDRQGIQEKKRQILPQDCTRVVREMFNFFNAPGFLGFLEGLTGIKKLIGDPYFHGGGFHEIYNGGKLAIHSDFRVHQRLNLQRRINVLIYLNKEWDPSYNGNLELWNADMGSSFEHIAPLFNRCVIFNTDSLSYHGHPEPLNTPAGITRKSIALYYYTASSKLLEEVPPYSTMYVSRKTDSLFSKKQALVLRVQNYLLDWLPPILVRKLVRFKSAR
jgi:hypothetical protein